MLVHTPDEPVDVVRESSVLLGPRTRELYAAMVNPATRDLVDHVQALYAESEPHDLDLDAAWDRITSVITDPVLARVRDGSEKLDWSWFGNRLVAAGLDPRGWDALLVGSAHIEHDLAGVPRLVDRVSLDSWTGGDAVLLTAAGSPG